MMIKINLLPVRQAAKRESGRQFLVGGLMFVVIVGFANYYWYWVRDTERGRKAEQVNETNRRITELDKVIGEVNKLNARKKEVTEKLAVLEKLRKQRAGPVRMLDALATCIPKKVWIDEFSEANSAVRLTGNADSHDDVSDFIKGLTNIVWTSKGMGRVVEQKRDASFSRVELLTGEGAMEDFPNAEISRFFTNIELKVSEAVNGSNARGRQVRFEITLLANYAI
jgi:type IV pilus assembly protein PilN